MLLEEWRNKTPKMICISGDGISGDGFGNVCHASRPTSHMQKKFLKTQSFAAVKKFFGDTRVKNLTINKTAIIYSKNIKCHVNITWKKIHRRRKKNFKNKNPMNKIIPISGAVIIFYFSCLSSCVLEGCRSEQKGCSRSAAVPPAGMELGPLKSARARRSWVPWPS